MIKITILAITLSFIASAQNKSICGKHDDRFLSSDPRIGRLATGDDHIGCTVTMISDKCGVTAGHCAPVLDYAEFNTPLSSTTGIPQASSLRDKYYVDKESIQTQIGKHHIGNDWAVVKFKKNKITRRFPGEVNGYYKIGLRIPRVGEKVTITGYGADKDNLDYNGAQQSHYGRVTKVYRRQALFEYHVDTMGGNSGGSILNSNNEIIGIHTNGGCAPLRGNLGVTIRFKKELKNAITKCLEDRF